jgi:signal peptidase II
VSDSPSTAAVQSRWRLRVLLAVGAVVIAADQFTKWWAVRALSDGPNDVVWTLRFRLIGNTGAAFSKVEGLGPVLGIIITVVVVAMFVFRDRIQVGPQFVAYSAIFGGAIGNLIDRLFRGDGWWRGAVVDFIDFQWYPVFNVADIAVVCGGIALLVMSWWAGRPLHETDPDTAT